MNTASYTESVLSSTMLLPIPHPVEIYFGFCVAGYRQARKPTFVSVFICLGFVCLFGGGVLSGLFCFVFWGFWLCFLFLLGCFLVLFCFEERKSILVIFLCFPIVYTCHLSCAHDSDPQTTHRKNAFLG